MRKTIVVLVALAMSACATNLQRFDETVTDPETGAIHTTTYSQKAGVTWGSKQDSAAGDMAYTGPDWGLSVGNAAAGQTAGDGNDAILGLFRLIAPVLASMATQPPTPSPISQMPAPADWDVLLETLRALQPSE